MNRTKIQHMPTTFAAILLTALLMPTAAMAKVNVEAGESTDFTKYQTYSWAPEAAAEQAPIHEHIQAAVDGQMEAQGLIRVENGGDLTVAATTETSQETQIHTYTYDPFPSPRYRRAWRWNAWGPITAVEISQETAGVLTVELIDADSGEMVWQGIATGEPRTKATKNIKKVGKVTARMFEEFPTTR